MWKTLVKDHRHHHLGNNPLSSEMQRDNVTEVIVQIGSFEAGNQGINDL